MQLTTASFRLVKKYFLIWSSFNRTGVILLGICLPVGR